MPITSNPYSLAGTNMLMLKALMLLVCLSSTSGWLVPMSGAVRPAVGPSACRSARMQETEQTTADADAFTEDLLDALAADEPLPSASPGVFVTAEGAEELEPMPSYTNHRTVEEARQKYKTHPTDTGSVQVQVAVLTARIAYMTKHMQDNKKDYASLRGDLHPNPSPSPDPDSDSDHDPDPDPDPDHDPDH